ncbi:MAG: CocE/NonD family hydrolase [Fidelibacterota bacterium]|nr:MAG: CocE/NonD family hydrolase [Candidatus Neomarinimicrobiota bacterium]
MRDGTQMATDLHFPSSGSGVYPAILMRTPYNKTLLAEYGRFYSEHEYVVAIQDVRGRYASEGEWQPFIHEGDDGYDTIEWLADQDWCTGKVGMVGGSYSGSVQFFAAVRKPPHLTTIIPNITPAMPFDNMPYEGGALLLGWAVRWTDIMESARTGYELEQKTQAAIRENWYERLQGLPVVDLDRKIIGRQVSYWRTWLMHDTNDAYWTPVNYLEALTSLDLPVFLQCGWFDGGNRGTKMAYVQLSKGGNSNVKMIVGPWIHSDRGSRYLGGSDMGPAAEVDLFDKYRRWFDYWLKGDDNGIMEEPQVQVYLMDSNRWLEADAYPLPNTSFQRLYLASGNDATSRVRSGKLQFGSPASQLIYDEYDYDPGNPTPSFYAYMKRNALIQYQHQVSSRDDILIYETESTTALLQIAGPISVVLYASSSAKDTDWVVTLYGINDENELYPIGLTFGALRARFRKSKSKPELIEPDQIYEYHIDLSHSAITIPAGHRLHLEIASAAFPEYSRNLNTGGHNEMEKDYVIATNRIYHSEKYPSHVLLPVLEE